ncbi:MAG: hypothetical protein HY827_00470 [Actinobacteria bacterium]|nr:hypothetical protein [Actinomycetota bacterium]
MSTSLNTDPKVVATVPNATTESSASSSKRRRRQPADWRTIALGSTAIFLAFFTLLAARMQSGLDPTLGTSASRQTAAVLQRRLIVKRKVIHETIVPADPVANSPAASASGYASAPAPSTTYSAPAPTYYAPAPAPVTRAS